MAQISGGGPAEMKALAARLREAPAGLKNELRRNMRKAAGPAVGKVKASILAMPATKGSPPGRVPLRTAIAGTVTSSVRITPTGVRLDIVSLGSRMPRGEGNMPAHVDARGGWGHPVFERGGRERVWVRQRGKAQWFERPIIDSSPQITAAVQAAIDETDRKLGG